MSSDNLLRKQVVSEIKKKRLIIFILIILSFIYLATNLLLGDAGLLKYRELSNKKLSLQKTITELENKLGKLIPIEEIEKELEGKLKSDEIEDAINKLNSSGDIFRPRRGYVQKT